MPLPFATMGLGVGRMGAARTKGGGVSYVFTNSEASALVARFTTQPTNARKALIDTLVGALKTAGVWSKLDAFYIMAAHDAQAAQRNWIADAYNLTPVNSPAFTVDRGYQGDGATSYLDTGFNPSTAPSPKFTQNSASHAVGSRTNGNTTQANGNANNTIVPSTGGSAFVRVNHTGGTAPSAVSPNSDGFFVANRSGANAQTLRRNGVSVISATDASSVPGNGNFWFCGRSAMTFSSLQQSEGFIGQSLTPTEQDAIYTARLAYMQAVGAF